MVVRVKLVGNGIPGDQYRVNLPTYHIILINYDAGWALVNLPDDVHELTDEELSGETHEYTSHGKLYATLSQPTLDKLHTKLDKKYVQPKGTFRVELA